MWELEWFSASACILYLYVLQLNNLRVSQRKEPYIGLTQENSMEFLIQDCLPYIH